MGKFFIRCRIHLKFCLRVRLKRCNDGGEFELDQARSKNDIAENSIALGHEHWVYTSTNSTSTFIFSYIRFCCLF